MPRYLHNYRWIVMMLFAHVINHNVMYVIHCERFFSGSENESNWGPLAGRHIPSQPPPDVAAI